MDNKKVKVSIVMTAYNSEMYIAETIKSILEQTYVDYELIIVDDGSTDSTTDIINSFFDNRITLICNNTNSGICFSSNRGIEAATGEYIARIDSDDICHKDRIEKQVEYLDSHDDIFMCAGSITRFKTGSKKQRKFIMGQNTEEIKFRLMYSNPICHSTVMFRREEYMSMLYCYKKYIHSQDYYLWTNFLVDGKKVAVINDCIVDYRENEFGITAVNGDEKNNIEAREIRKEYIKKMINNSEIESILIDVISGDINKYRFENYYGAIKYWANVCFEGCDTKSYIQEFVFDIMLKAQSIPFIHIIESVRKRCFGFNFFFTKRGLKLVYHSITNKHKFKINK